MGDTLMGKKYIVVGDATSHGGKVQTGSALFDIKGKAIARLGDKVSCPIHGENAITEGDPGALIDGVPCALEGHRSACGSVLIGTVVASHGG